MAHVEKRPPRTRDGRGKPQWRARYTVNGRERSRTFARKADAEAFLATAQAAQLRGEWVDPKHGRVTFGDWAERWLTEGEGRKRATTAARDRTVLAKHFLPALGRRPLGKITTGDVRATVDAMRNAGLSASTVRTNYGVLRAALAAAVDAELIVRTPCRGIRLDGEGRKRELRFLSVEELGRLADAVGPDYRALVWLAGVLGLRWSEAAGLRVGRVDFLRRTLRVEETVAEVGGRHVVAGPKTAASRRTLAVPGFVLEELSEYLARQGLTAEDQDALVFTSPEGGPLRAANFRRRVWAPAVRAAGLDGLTFHGLRHTAVGLMIQAGAHVEAIKVRMGHSSIRVTSDVYGHVLPSVEESIVGRLDELVRSSHGPITAHRPERRNRLS